MLRMVEDAYNLDRLISGTDPKISRTPQKKDFRNAKHQDVFQDGLSQ